MACTLSGLNSPWLSRLLLLPLEPARSDPQLRSEWPLEPARCCSGPRLDRSSPPRSRSGARNGRSSPPRRRSGARNGRSSLPSSRSCARNGYASLPRSRSRARNGPSIPPLSRSRATINFGENECRKPHKVARRAGKVRSFSNWGCQDLWRVTAPNPTKWSAAYRNTAGRAGKVSTFSNWGLSGPVAYNCPETHKVVGPL
jgi:hypothetical protein